MSGALPKGWVETTFPHVALLNPKSSLDDDTEVAFVPMPHVPTNFSDTLRFEKKLWRDVKRGFTHFRNDDVIFAKITPCFENGKAAIVAGLPNSHGAGSTEFYVLRPVIVPSAFLFYWVKTNAFLKTAEAHMTGTVGQKRVPKTFVESHPLPLPPLNEQKRIVAKLDAIMPRIDSVKERLEKIPAILKRFRQSVLTAALTGKLTEKWREEHPEVESAEELLESIFKAKQALCKQNVVSKLKIVDESDMFFSTPVNWKWCRLSEITLKMSTGPFGTMLHKSDYVDNGIPVINPTNIVGEKIIASDKITISKSKYEELLRYSLKENNIVLARRGDLSKCGIVRKEQSNWLCGTGSFFLEVAISPVYFRLFYVSNYCQAPLNEDSIGSTMSNLNQSVLSNIAFPLPPLDEQKEIVRQVDKLFALAEKVEDHYQKARARVDALAQSVLAKAFRGELVPQDPDDEPAEKLLQRIREEKANMENEMKTASRSARGTRRNGAKIQRAKSEEKQAGEP
jgi:type I restriction enzyme S subunit